MVGNNTVAKALHLRRLATEGLISEDLAAASAEGEVNNMLQSHDEVLRIADEWLRNFRPSNLVPSKKNAEKILVRCLDVKGLVSITYMSESAQELAAAGQLELYPEPQQPKELTQEEKAAEFQKRQFTRHQKDQLENSEAAFFERVKRAEEAKKLEREAQEQAAAEVALNNEILRYECYSGPNRIDHSKSEAFRKDLFKIEVRRNGKRDAKLTLATVREAISNLP